jgi:tripartite-type tricarboxylate transporter receptor subunit TctC
MLRATIFVGLLLLTSMSGIETANAQSVEEFYKGKQVRMIIGYPVGSGYDVHARLLARHLGRHIPGRPTVIPQNMEGAGSVRAANHIYDIAAKDGLTIGAINRAVPFGPLLGITGKQLTTFDALQYGWIGSMNTSITVAMVWAASGITKFEDLLKRETVVSADATSSDSFVFAQMLNNLFGTKLKIVTGYAGTSSHYLAMERGETTGYLGSAYSSLLAIRPDWVRDRKVNLLMQISLAKDPRLPEVPSITTYANEAQLRALELLLAPQQMGRPYMTTPGVDPARLEALRTAFMATMTDPEFVADAKKMNTDIEPMDGPAVRELIAKVYRSPPEAVEAVKKILRPSP